MSQDESTMSRQALMRAVASYDTRSLQIGEARAYTGAFLDRVVEAGVVMAQVQREDALLVVSELVTNTVRHAPGPCTLALALHSGVLEIAVSDTSGRPPQAQSFQPERVGQHGLEVVLALCVTVGTDYTDTGKTIRARLPIG
jgi:anti-sigma regulatory factor (Ser/Thr protein kinase)